MRQPTETMGKVMGKMKGAKQVLTGGAGIFETLAEQHGEISTMIRRCGASKKNSPVRADLFPRIKNELLAHAKAEEKEVYSVFRTIPELTDKISHSVDEHKKIEQMLDELTVMGYDHDDWFEKFHAFGLEVQKHVIEEEQQVFPKAKKVIDKDRSHEIEAKFLDARNALLDKNV